MFRYIDLDVVPGRTYQYKVVLWMEDPNDPDQRGSLPPRPKSLDPEVRKRVFAKNSEKAIAKLKRKDESVVNFYYRMTEASEPSEPVTVTYGRRIILGTATSPRIKKSGFTKATDEPKAEMMALEFDRENATNAVSYTHLTLPTIYSV